MNPNNLSDDLREQLIESAAWGKANITPRVDERGGKKGDEAAKGKKGDKPDFTTDERKGDKSKSCPDDKDYENSSSEYEYDEDAEELEEDFHICPLCTSFLDEPIDEECLLEHLDVVLSLVDRLSQINEDEEDIDQVIDEVIADTLFGEEEEEE